eukprot:32353-Eustigmatos_ZCMA.PRE.1
MIWCAAEVCRLARIEPDCSKGVRVNRSLTSPGRHGDVVRADEAVGSWTYTLVILRRVIVGQRAPVICTDGADSSQSVPDRVAHVDTYRQFQGSTYTPQSQGRS